MIYADADFFLALIKPKDWLRERAMQLHAKHRNELTTSVATIIEVLIVGRRFALDPEMVVESMFLLVPRVSGIDGDTAAIAAHLIKKKDMTVFDAFHAAFCGDDTMLSSDRVFDRIGIKRFSLEKA